MLSPPYELKFLIINICCGTKLNITGGDGRTGSVMGPTGWMDDLLDKSNALQGKCGRNIPQSGILTGEECPLI